MVECLQEMEKQQSLPSPCLWLYAFLSPSAYSPVHPLGLSALMLNNSVQSSTTITVGS